MKSIKGQTFVEFLLVFVVLLAAASGVFVMYKKAWQSKYSKTGFFSGKAAAGAKIIGTTEIEVPLVGTINTDYVK